MNRPKRVVKPTLKIVENTTQKPPPKLIRSAPIQKPAPKQKEPPRTLDLDSTPQEKLDRGEMTNAFWTKYFYTPNDSITQRYNNIKEYYIEKLPASFYDGLGLLEIKDEYKEPIKKTPLYSSLIKGEYQTEGSKSDKNIASAINFFRNNLPSFKQYKDDDSLKWIVDNQRLLIIEILEQAKTNFLSILTIKSRFNAIARIFRIAFGGKSYVLYEKLSAMIIFIGEYFSSNDKNNKLSENEQKKYLSWSFILQKQMQLQIMWNDTVNKKTQQAFDLNNDLLLISLYTLIPPLRNEVKHLQFTKNSERKGDYIYFRAGEVLLDLNEIKKRHDPIMFNLTEQSANLANLLKESYELYPREPVFSIKNKYPIIQKASEASLDTRLSNLFKLDYPDLNISVNSFRSSYVSYRNFQAVSKGTLLSANEKELIAKKMRTSTKYLDETYLKIPDVVVPRVSAAIPVRPIIIQQQDSLSSYQKQLARNNTYYQQNREKVLEKQKEYNNTKTPYEKTRVKLLRYLNTDEEYSDKMRENTMNKYNFKKINGVWV